MRELRVLREVQEREARRALGRNPRSPQQTPLHAQTGALEASILALPEDTSQLVSIQTADGLGFLFMLGFSALGGSDPLA